MPILMCESLCIVYFGFINQIWQEGLRKHIFDLEFVLVIVSSLLFALAGYFIGNTF